MAMTLKSNVNCKSACRNNQANGDTVMLIQGTINSNVLAKKPLKIL